MRTVKISAVALAALVLAGCSSAQGAPKLPERLLQEEAPATSIYHVKHEKVQATVFQIGKIYDPGAGDEGQSLTSAWDGDWSAHYGGCDGIGQPGLDCQLDQRSAANGYFPTAMTPKENPFYVALPLDDTAETFTEALPWPSDAHHSALKNRWIEVSGAAGTCYGQVQDSGPTKNSDPNYVLRGATPYQPGPAIALSPALSACVGVNNTGTVSWSFAETPAAGPWMQLVTTSTPPLPS